jgi:hypothetical protein
MKRLVFVMVLAVVLVMASFASLPGLAQPKAQADNNCGNPKAGAFYNGTSSGIQVNGDTWSSGVITVWVQPFHTANDYGICDADFFWVPAGAQRLYWFNGSTITTYYPGNMIKIGMGPAICQNESLSVIKCNY